VSGINIPQEYTIHLNPVNLTGGVGLTLGGSVILDAGLDDIHVSATGDPNHPIAIDLGLDNIHIKVDPLRLTLDPLRITLDPMKVDLGLDHVNVCLSLAVTEFPRMRVHVPTRYDFGFSLFGIPVMKFTAGGETVVVTQDNPPRLFQQAETSSTDVSGFHGGSRSRRASAELDTEPFHIDIREDRE